MFSKWLRLSDSVGGHVWVRAARKWLFKQSVILGLAVVVTALLILANELNFHAASEASRHSTVAAQRQASIYDLQRLLLDAETGQRGYIPKPWQRLRARSTTCARW
ncbi:CHASE3 domain-containing protein [Rhodoferax antarcticus]|uniref:CHASE3 domain-containing protein n=1 Tax=Rhodoferax antarcticus ANT.BR TaxID=1111071 RepID=A0A1Q8YIU1_9BURK|nr:hypothetical protein [Rhodoferax antarcticus]MCW2313883.1 hypothetical protein [Rhodoferax antarcticus]OLP07839.1 hypothetical protein BLL52_0936 [Rhodoferax antarcticus ANT.BR]